MLRRLGTFAFIASTLTLVVSNTFAQSNLTAKATAPQPAPAVVVPESDRIRDGLVGPVRRVRTEVAKLLNENGKVTEAKHAVLEVISYDLSGNKIENQYFPIAGATLTGKESYKYDDKGNINEMTLVNADGSLLSKETYKYEFDFAGNWNKMTTSVAVIEGGKMSFEPTEVTYRSIMYYLDENMMRMSQPNTSTASQPSSSMPASSGNVAAVNSEAKSVSLANKPTVSNNSSSGQKTSPALPGSVNTADKISALGTVEVGSTRSNANIQAPVVHLESDPPPAPRPILKPVSGGVLNGTAISLPSPSYPDAAKRLRMAGVVSIEVVVDETGKVISAVATSGPPMLRDVAVQAAMRARFSPTKLSGQPVKVSGVINYKFALAQ